jgi:predicted PurR-regulated permease PerM
MTDDENLHCGLAEEDQRSSRTMSFTRPIVFWIAMLAALVAVVVLLREVLLPFVVAMVLAYLLDPLADLLERRGMSRLQATLVIVAVVVVTIAVLIVLTVPVIVRELAYFVDSFPRYVGRLHQLATDPGRPWLSKIIGEGFGEAERSFGELTTLASSWFGTFLRSAWAGGRALMSVVSLGLVAPIVACYLLYDWNRMIAAIDNWVPPARRETVRALAREVDDTIGGFVRGQSALCLILALYYAASLWLIGLNHGALIGTAAGLLSFIPYLGSLSGLAMSICVAVAQFWPHWTPVLLVLVIFFVGQSLGDYVLSPHLVGKRVHLNPVWVMFALFAFGFLFGFVGLLIAVPFAAAIGVLVRFSLRQYLASPLYAQAAAAAPPAMDGSVVPVNRQDEGAV